VPSSKKRILIADAHATMAAGVRLLLGNIFDVTVMVADIQSLSDAVVRSGFDVVIANLSIPRISDENVVRLIKRLRPDLPIIVLSVHDDPAVISECRSSGAEGIVLMREAVNDLIPAVEAVLRGCCYVSPSLREATA